MADDKFELPLGVSRELYDRFEEAITVKRVATSDVDWVSMLLEEGSRTLSQINTIARMAKETRELLEQNNITPSKILVSFSQHVLVTRDIVKRIGAFIDAVPADLKPTLRQAIGNILRVCDAVDDRIGRSQKWAVLVRREPSLDGDWVPQLDNVTIYRAVDGLKGASSLPVPKISPDGGYLTSQVCEAIGCSLPTFGRYAQAVGVPRASRGQNNFRYGDAEVNRLMRYVSRSASNRKHRDAALAWLTENEK